MVKLFTEVNCGKLPVTVSLNDRIAVLGSCFADNVCARMKDAGFAVCANPFGTLYNPASIAKAVERLDSARPFTPEECVEMGAGAGKICSFSHHSSFARTTAEEFLANANAALSGASLEWRASTKVIVTLGTAFVWCHEKEGVVCNCLKRPESEFERRMLTVAECTSILDSLVASHPDKEFIFTVSPIRHLSQGAHENTLSKSTLHLSLPATRVNACYFPAYEILMDELRDYRFYSDDLCHPSSAAVSAIWEKFISAAVPKSEWELIAANEKASLRQRHVPILR